MPLNETDKAWVREEIRTAHERQGQGKLPSFIKDWSGTAAAVTILIVVFTQWSAYVEFKTATNIRLDRIEKALIPVSIQAQVGLPDSDFAAALPSLGSTLQSAKKAGVKVPPQVVNDLSKKLGAADSNVSGYWPTAAVLISYRSSLLVGSTQNWNKQFPPCMEPMLDPTLQVVGPDDKPTGPKIVVSHMTAQDCSIELDGRTIVEWDCTRCLVRYSGGPLTMRAVHFIDCLFVFDFPSGPPSGDGPTLTRNLLASNLKDVTVPAA